ncbi:multiheme c-type cytochrome [Botrimarina sp.]|uniref:multiheme c-type cytochrome n=1 Tax=Botrimarina sp. TaxID=2795802 RepID=UPI0032EBDBB4
MPRLYRVVVCVTLLAAAPLVLTALAQAPPKAEQPGGEDPPPYLADEEDLPEIAERYGLDADALERLRRAHHHLVEHQQQPKPDPVEANGPVFVDWPKPDAAIVFTGEQIGYLEPCGCAGLENQKGGLKRRHTMIRTLREKWGWPLVLLDAGEQVRYFGKQADIKHRHTIEALIQMGYDAVGLGVMDLRTELLGLAINLDEAENPLTSANVAVLDFDSGFTKRWRVVEVGGAEGQPPVRIGVTHVLGDKARSEVAPTGDLTIVPADEALTELLPQIDADACDQNVLMVYGDRAEAEALARRFDVFDWVVAARGSDEPRIRLDEANRIEGATRGGGPLLIEVGHKGMYAVVVGLYRKPDAPADEPGAGWEARYQKVPLDHRWADSPAMYRLLVRYQDELQSLGWEGLGLEPKPHLTERDFAGSAVCADCHTAAWEVFEKTPHYHTSETLVALEPARHFDPECIACHAVGWEPQKYFPFASGWKSYRETPEMFGQGCENCHGPAARHAAAEYGDIEVDDAEMKTLREALHLEIQPNEGNMPGQLMNSTTKAVNNCLGCHDLDNSPDFDFQKYWPEVAHEGVD